MITEKQINYIWNVLGKKELIHYEDIKKLTKKEATGIIKRNIIEHRPLLQWYCMEYEDGSLCAKKFRAYNINDEYFLNKRLLNEHVGVELEEYRWNKEMEIKNDKE